MIYRIYTEDKNRQKIEAIVGKYRDGYTLIPAKGVWQGAKERSLIIEIITGSQVDKAIQRDVTKAIAREIKAANNQQAVYVVELEEVSWLV